MSYPQGYLYQPAGSLALYSCPAYSASALTAPRSDELGRASSGSAFSPYAGSAAFTAPSAGFTNPLQYSADPATGFPSYMGSPYDAHATGMAGTLSYHPYGNAAYPYQLNDPAYRKNATRDATATLKAWLNEHRKNPYPTKGEKIMLAIITKMTLTQVSTWFANARRRLKKENKMTWGARNKEDDGTLYGSDTEGENEKKEEDEEIDLESIDIDKIDENDEEQSNGEEEEKLNPSDEREKVDLESEHDRTLQGSVVDSKARETDRDDGNVADSNGTRGISLGQGNLLIPNHSKPKIWSLAETATSPDSAQKSSPTNHTQSTIQHPAFLSNHGLYTCQISKFHNWTNGAFLGQNSLLNVRSFLGANHHHHHHHQQQQSAVLTAALGAMSNEKSTDIHSPKHTERDCIPGESPSQQLKISYQPLNESSRPQQEGTRVLAGISSV